MFAKESAGPNFDLPEEVLDFLPSDPFEQLDVARKITSIALSTRVSSLESEASALRAQLLDKDALIADLQSQLRSLDAALSDAADNLVRAERDKDSLLRENAQLSNTVRKLSRDVSKLESFKKTLMQSLQDEDNHAGPSWVAATQTSTHASLSSQSLAEDDAALPPSRASSLHSQISETGNPYAEDYETDASKPRISLGPLLASQASTPRFTPPGSPPSLSASVSPTRSSKPVSPRRHSISFSTSRGRTRVDGKEFFRQVRNRLSYEQFAAFLANVKELNSHKQTKEDTLRKADEIFGPDNKDLFIIFEGLINRNVN
ncbi:uncharacterized protein At4g15545 isoform X3 [Diospyros lotus]|uniref:uncharacterized protein At4g15545 isoform X3 n=1 Tax=Diospyros lotus TaxID=55363 RepID=UPI00225491A5|nr:uncharacterized protein At4g15545 isoform X3 [Diospyros lotus]